MKYKKNIVIIFALLLSAAVFSFAAERTDRNAYPESKFVDRFSSSSLREDDGTGSTEGEITGGINLGDPNEAYKLNGPVGDAFPLLITFGLAYGIYVFIEKRKRTEIK